VTATLLNQVRRLRRGLADGGCRCRPVVLDRGGPYGSTEAPSMCPNCGRPPRLLALQYDPTFYDHAQRSGEATP
jgi:hypothetical protein